MTRWTTSGLVAAALLAAPAAYAQDGPLQELRDFLIAPQPPAQPGAEGQAPPAEPLTLGATVQGNTGPNNQKVFTVRTEGPGLLSVLVSSPVAETDLWVQVMSAKGLPGGNEQRADNDPGGMMGLEYLAVPVGEAGDQQITVGCNGDAANFTIVTSYVPLPWLAKALPKAPDVGAAVDLRLNTPLTRNAAGGQGEFKEWFVLSAPADAGHMVVLTKADPGDLAMELFQPDQLFQPTMHVDNDPGGQMGNEALVIRMQPDQRLFLRVTARGAEKYTIEARYLHDAPQPF